MGSVLRMSSLSTLLLLTVLASGVTPAPSLEEWPGEWYYLETYLEGGRVLSLMNRHCVMAGNHHDDHQKWRLKADGCLENKSKPGMCLAVEGNIEGALLSLHEANGMESQKWKHKDNYFESYIRSNLFHYHLLLGRHRAAQRRAPCARDAAHRRGGAV